MKIRDLLTITIQEQDLKIRIENSLKTSAQHSAVIRSHVESQELSGNKCENKPENTMLLHKSTVCPNLEHCVQFSFPGVDLERSWSRAAKITVDMKWLL